jgi:mono/diheme cytochrome c family protein
LESRFVAWGEWFGHGFSSWAWVICFLGFADLVYLKPRMILNGRGITHNDILRNLDDDHPFELAVGNALHLCIISFDSSCLSEALEMARCIGAILLILVHGSVWGADTETPAERGRRFLLTRNYNTAGWKPEAYQNAWKQWGVKEKPADYDRAFNEYYGLHPAPFPNNGLPMGLRQGTFLFQKGLATDCLVCHGGSILGQSYVGLGNASLEIEALFDDMSAVSGVPARTPFHFTNVRGTSEAGTMAVFLLSYRNPDLSLRRPRHDFPLRDNMCEDPPAWWLLHKKKTMYHTAEADARSVRSIMQFMMSPLNPPTTFEQAEADFRDIQQFLYSLRPPKYPHPVDETLAAKGKRVFTAHCSKCHGTYGEKWTYPNRVLPIDEIGTDRKRLDGFTEEFARYYNTTWFAREKPGWFTSDYKARPRIGYQAPPLDGIWATAPYLHNGSVPTVYHLLKSDSRPKIYTRSFRTGADDYDPKRLGWKVTELKTGPDPALPAVERRKVYDTTQPGRGNSGHKFGDKLSDDDRWAVIEYLKTI